MNLDSRPIGVFDSGVGGLSVLSQLIQSFPQESFVYLGDTARLPYGSKSPQTIQRYVTQNINYLVKNQNIKAVVIACNSASTVLSEIKIEEAVPVYGMIIPGAKAAYQATKNKKIAIWATRATVKQNSYKKELLNLDTEIQSYSIACPLLVPLVEEGLWEGTITESIIDMYLQQLDQTDVDTLILGCTHYPFIRNAIEKRIKFYADKIPGTPRSPSLNPNLKIVDSAKAICEELSHAFETNRILRSPESNDLNLLLTDEASHFMNLVLKTFPSWKNIKFQLIDLHQIV
jgi:glutamate racemase